jgi:hypothetical protein
MLSVYVIDFVFNFQAMQRTGTPTKLGFSQRAGARSGYMAPRLDADIDEEGSSRSRSGGRSTAEAGLGSGRALQRRETSSLSPGRSDLISPKEQYSRQSSNRSGRNEPVDDGNYGFEQDKEFERDREREQLEMQERARERRRQREREAASPREKSNSGR